VQSGYADASPANTGLYANPGVTPMNGACNQACLGKDWTCVGSILLPGATNAPTKLQSPVTDFFTSKAIVGADASLCLSSDLNCDSPIAAGQTDQNGYLVIDVPAEPAGAVNWLQADSYVQVMASGYVPELVYLGYPVSRSPAPIAEPNLVVFAADEVQAALSTVTGVPDGGSLSWDMADYGLLGFEVLDCSGFPGEGAQVTISPTAPAETTWYYEGANPTASASATTTDTMELNGLTGLGEVVNVPPGDVTVTATPRALCDAGACAVSSKLTVHVRAGTVTFLFLFPNQ
jgi:hypothetical protein